MDSRVRIENTIDMDLVKAIVTEPEIWERASDGLSKEEFYPGYDSMTCWLLCIENDTPIGVILLHTDNSASLRMHPYLRAQFREKGRIMMKAFYEWLIASTKDEVNKVIVSIPETHKKVINFAKKVGFKTEGFNRESYRKDGKLYGQQNLGITRNEIIQYLAGLE